MFRFMRWIKEFSLDTGLDDVTALEGYPSLQAVEKLQRLRADFASGSKKTIPTLAETAAGIGPLPSVTISAPAPANRAEVTSVADHAPERRRSTG